MKLPEKNIADILLEQYCEGYNRRDLAFILDLFCKNCNVWGTAVDEYRMGHDELKTQHERDWSQSEKGIIKIIKTVPTDKNAQWAAVIAKAIVTIDGEEHTFDHLRGTITVAQEDGKWKISHMHCSFPDLRTEEGSSFPGSAI